ncbi:MAG TPA: hypothetical protein VF747_14510 [Blastocatellia bacterium]|jgi:hypothetical protein
MTIRLVKRNQQAATTDKPAPPPSANQIMLNAKGWVEEFKARKARTDETLIGALRRN